VRDQEKEAEFEPQGCALSERAADFILAMLALTPDEMDRVKGFIQHPDRIEIVFKEGHT
jgi:hypothetical protein